MADSGKTESAATPEQISEAANKAEAIIAKWVDIAYRTMLAGLGGDGTEPEQRKAVEQMRHLHLAEPHLPARQIAVALAAETPAKPTEDMIWAAAKALWSYTNRGGVALVGFGSDDALTKPWLDRAELALRAALAVSS